MAWRSLRILHQQNCLITRDTCSRLTNLGYFDGAALPRNNRRLWCVNMYKRSARDWGICLELGSGGVWVEVIAPVDRVRQHSTRCAANRRRLIAWELVRKRLSCWTWDARCEAHREKVFVSFSIGRLCVSWGAIGDTFRHFLERVIGIPWVSRSLWTRRLRRSNRRRAHASVSAEVSARSWIRRSSWECEARNREAMKNDVETAVCCGFTGVLRRIYCIQENSKEFSGNKGHFPNRNSSRHS